ncbi:MAG: hypothetical protein KAV87_47985 [Desulfobacteraceae bacterium]|nr:hypothetical protein [Desulfobacteraceae bacterium]
MTENKYKFLNDRPTKKDTIGHYEIIANQLFETVHCNLDKPFVIGLFGSWGTGKSSIIEMLKARCEKEQKEKTEVVVIDAWRKEKDIFNRQFLKKIGRELLSESDFKKVKDEVEKKTTDNWSKWNPTEEAEKEYKKYRLLILLLILGTVIYWLITKGYEQVFPIGAVAAGILAWFIARYFQYLLPKYSIRTDSTVKNVAVHDIDHFREVYFDKIIGKTKAECVCIVVDNLDRVEAEDALTIIRTLKTFIVDAKEDKGTEEEVNKENLNKVVFVVPCCDKELKKHIKASEAVGDETEFIHKFFNVTFRIPEFREQDAFQYARGLLYKMELDFVEKHKNTICHILSEGYGKNPRKAKIFLNNFLMSYNVAKVCEEAGKIEAGVITEHPDWLAIYMADEELGAGSQCYFKRLSREIDPECKAAIRFLKRPNDFDLIGDFDELLQMARRNEEKFAEQLSERASESREIIDAIWRNISVADIRSQVNVIASVICAIEKKGEIVVSPSVTDQMALCLASQYPQDLEDMSGKLVYERILKGKPGEVVNIIKNFGQTVNGIKCSQGQIQYSVDVLQAVLEDTESLFKSCQATELNKLKQEIPQAIERLIGLGDEILPIAIKYPNFKSEVVFNRSLERCKEGYFDILPDNIIEYCMALEDTTKDKTQFIKKVIQCFNEALGYFQNEEVWDSEANEEVETKSKECASFLKALRSINSRAHKHDMPSSDSDTALETLDTLFDYVDDSNKLEIIDTYVDYEKFEKWSETVDTAINFYESRGQELLEDGSEHTVYKFIKKNRELVNQRLHPHINTAGKRYKSVCNLVLEAYPERRKSIISDLWNDKSDWVCEWIKDNASKMNKEQKREIQDILFGIAKSNEYPIDVYQTLSYLKIGNYKKAVDARNRHFDELIESEELSTIEGLEFVLERIDKASYRTTDEQNDLLNNGWRDIDQRTAGNELKRLVKEVIRT